jgi:hypothetical protein
MTTRMIAPTAMTPETLMTFKIRPDGTFLAAPARTCDWCQMIGVTVRVVAEAEDNYGFEVAYHPQCLAEAERQDLRPCAPTPGGEYAPEFFSSLGCGRPGCYCTDR